MTDGLGPNADQYDHWNDREAKHWVTYQDLYDASLGGFGTRLLDAARPWIDDTVLDVGCGCGATTLLAAQRARSGRVVGIDLSGPMLAVARERAVREGLSNVRFEQADAQTHAFAKSAFDVVLSRFGVMFFADPVAAFTNVHRALRAGGRLAFVCWQDLLANEWLAVPASAALAHVPMPDLGDAGAPGAFAFADPDDIRNVLGASGFNAVHIEPVHDQLYFGTTLDDAMSFLADTGIAKEVFAKAEPTAIEKALAAIRDALAPYEMAQGVQLGGAAWLVTARRSKETTCA